MATRELFDLAADVGSDEEDEDFDEETGEAEPKKSTTANGIDDSSEEEDEDDDELLAQASRPLTSNTTPGISLTTIQEGAGFVVDEDEDEEEEARRRRRRKKRKNREVDEALDDEDLDLIGVEVERPDTEQASEPHFMVWTAANTGAV